MLKAKPAGNKLTIGDHCWTVCDLLNHSVLLFLMWDKYYSYVPSGRVPIVLPQSGDLVFALIG